ncbi:MAG: hypothetical protein KZQ97_00250 [Candidatus Thiodiazotropha sp. (ex Dulcina madagascariensis)]|nr:hypothetical protein [Candidatus Thiodiazotropha sp. (ex Dulcina madagascariensis)]
MSAIHKALRDDGVYLMQDIEGSSHLHNDMGHPIGPLLYTISTMHCMTVSLAQDGAGLGTAWGRELAVQHPVSAPYMGAGLINSEYMD